MTRQRQQIKRALAQRDRARADATVGVDDLVLRVTRPISPPGQPLNAWQRWAWSRLFGGR